MKRLPLLHSDGGLRTWAGWGEPLRSKAEIARLPVDRGPNGRFRIPKPYLPPISSQGRTCGGFRNACRCRTPPQPPGPAYESPQGRNPREAGHRELHNAMRISPPPSACERLAARLERCTGLRGNAQRQPRQRESRAGTAGSRLAEAPIASVAMRLDERRRGRHISGGEGGQQSEWKRAQSCS